MGYFELSEATRNSTEVAVLVNADCNAIFIGGNESLHEIIQKRVWARVLKNRPSEIKRKNQKKPRGCF
ncbi:hypothetical protein HYT23_06810 [Candidatus Pacearchaeota archaeon]|nr:hypothetical protein [Candidatus Pacearchaeota archaeon]